MTERLVTARELGELVSLAPGTVLDQWEAGKLPGYKIGRAIRFDPDEILAMTRREPPAPIDRPLMPSSRLPSEVVPSALPGRGSGFSPFGPTPRHR